MKRSANSEEAPDASGKRARWTATLAGTYFFVFMATLTWTYLPRYFVEIGWTSAGIGTALGAMTVVRGVGQTAWAQISDARKLGSRVVKLQFLLGFIPLAALPFVSDTFTVYAVLFAFGLTIGGAGPLLDILIVREISSRAFGRIRSWGSAGYGVAALGAAALGIAWTHGDIANLAPWLAVAFYGIAGLVVLAMPRSRRGLPAYDWKQALDLLRRPWLLGMMGIWAMHWASQAPYNLFIVFLFEEHGFGGWTPGAAVAVGVAAEVVVLARSDVLLRRIAPGWMLAFCIGATAVRWWATALIMEPWVAVAVQLLHGFSFGGFLVAVMAILDREIPASIRATGQAFLYVAVFGLGSAVGNSLSGFIHDAYGAATLFTWAGWLEVALLLPALFVARHLRTRTSHA